MSAFPPWLTDAVHAEASGRVDDALDLIFNQLDGLCEDSDFETVNAVLALPGLTQLSTDLLLGVITVTRNYRLNLPNRKALCAKARDVFAARGEHGDLLANLDI